MARAAFGESPRLQVRVHPRDLARLRTAAEAERVTVSVLVRAALRAFLSRQPRELDA
jgi:hypothetical protein